MSAGAPPAGPDLDAAILELLAARDAGKTICPSEAARRVEPEAWRERMDDARTAARRLAADGRVEILQRGEVIDPEGPLRGPIRLRAIEVERG